eukprot:CAMPEP_0170558582 /NCGR_PEP_ID=MMETSP0211-20121228/36290_1 /TAXON_ID=311385 /ORGANISM="Pseudokeronopsis sp., Strain OXSARD2" /LENGTH=102 /DNA_ID=CAMNT_0010870657 /DNA_START=24 /DNA_END=332 /DNA_ORIENTATION=+
MLEGLFVLVEEAHQEEGVEQVRQDQVQKCIAVRYHADPKEKAHHTGASQTVEVGRGEPFRVPVLSEVDQLGDQGGSFQEDREGHKHLEGKEELAFGSRMEDH